MKHKVLILILVLTTPFITGFFWDPAYVRANKLYEEGKYEEAYRLYSEITSKEDPNIKQAIQFRLHEMLISGNGVAKNFDGAIANLEKVTEGPDKTWVYLARTNLADIYLEGKYVPQDLTKAINYYTLASASGKIEDRVRTLQKLGSVYAFENYGVKRDLNRALDYWLECNRLLSFYCEKSIEIYKDHPEVILRRDTEEYAKSSVSIAPAGMEKAYLLFKEAKYKEAYEIFLWHARNGNAEAQLELYRLYSLGLIGKNQQKATGWLFLSAKNGNAASQNELGSLINSGVIGGRESDVLFWFNLSAGQNYSSALNNLGIFYTSPSIETKEPPDYKRALRYFQKAAEFNLPVAFNNLGVMYMNGLGVDKNLDIARAYFVKGSELGDLKAKSNLYLNFGVSDKPSDKSIKVTQQEINTKKVPKQPLKQSQADNPKKNITEDTPIQTNSGIDVDVPNPPNANSQNKASETPLNPIELYSQTSPSVYKILAINTARREQGVSQGSGVAISAKNVITNCHVIEKMTSFGTKLESKVILFKLLKKEDKKDICVLTSETSLPPVKGIRRFDSLKVGEKVYAIGSPEGLENTLTEGLISGLRRDKGVKLIQTSASISHGSSGGGLFDSNGQLIGITSSGIEGTNLNFAISIDELPEL